MRIVVKVGGEVVRSTALSAIAQDLVTLCHAGHDLIVVHGGGPQVTELQQQLGQAPQLVAGRRVTDDAVLDVLKMVVGGKLNIELCAALLRAGASPVGLHGASALVLEARRRPPVVVAGAGPDPIDFGNVGDVVAVRTELLDGLLASGHLPVLACLGADRQGAIYNINADVVAAAVAVRTRAKALVLVTDVPGVLRDPHDPASRLPHLQAEQLDALIANGTITRGMIPKLKESFEALRSGVEAVYVVGRLAPGDLCRAVDHPGSVGTVLRA